MKLLKKIAVISALLLSLFAAYEFGSINGDSEVVQAKSKEKITEKTITVKVGQTVARDPYKGDIYLQGLSSEHFVLTTGYKTEFLMAYEYPVEMKNEFKYRDTDVYITPITYSLRDGTVTFKVKSKK